MNLIEFLAQVRDHYVDQFRSFADEQRARFATGAAEVKMRLAESSGIYAGLYCVDFVGTDDGHQLVELSTESFLQFERIDGMFCDAALAILDLRWDDVVLRHDLEDYPEAQLDRWFRHWLDPDDARHVKGAEIGEVIHSLLVEPGRLNIDFGTAPAEALWELLELLEAADATTIAISSSRRETEES